MGDFGDDDTTCVCVEPGFVKDWETLNKRDMGNTQTITAGQMTARDYKRHARGRRELLFTWNEFFFASCVEGRTIHQHGLYFT